MERKSAAEVRRALLLRRETALLDLRHEAALATEHRYLPPTSRLIGSASRRRRGYPARPCRSCCTTTARADRGGCGGVRRARVYRHGGTRWRARRLAGYELFADVNSYAKAFGELVEVRRHTLSLAADEAARLIDMSPTSPSSMRGGRAKMRR